MCPTNLEEFLNTPFEEVITPINVELRLHTLITRVLRVDSPKQIAVK
jgi:hypothetical protein